MASNDQNNTHKLSMHEKMVEYRRWLSALIPALLGVTLFSILFYKYANNLSNWNALATLAAAIVIAFAAVAAVRFAIAPLIPSAPPSTVRVADQEALMRTRIAPLVLGIGSIAIIALAIGLVIAFAVLASTEKGAGLMDNIDTLLVGIFSSVLPVFATWVGTVIAFYFTTESFREAATASRQAAGVPSVPKVSERMIPYEKIAKIERDRAKVREVKMEEIVKMMNEQVTRVIIFDTTRQPVFIIRRRTPPMPEGWEKEPKDYTVDDYIKHDPKNAEDAVKFGYVAQSATMDNARSVMRDLQCKDIFVTLSGQKTEQVLGWLTDDLLQNP